MHYCFIFNTIMNNKRHSTSKSALTADPRRGALPTCRTYVPNGAYSRLTCKAIAPLDLTPGRLSVVRWGETIALTSEVAACLHDILHLEQTRALLIGLGHGVSRGDGYDASRVLDCF